MKLLEVIKKSKKSLKIFDLIFFGVVIFGLIFFYFFFRRDVREIVVRFKVTDSNPLYAITNPSYEYANAFIVGDTEKDELGKTDAEIVNVNAYDIDPLTRVVYLDIKLRAVYNPRKNTYSLRGQDLDFGESIIFNLNKVKVKGLVVDFPGLRNDKEIVKKTAVVEAQIRYDNRYFSDVYGIPQFLADAIHPGDVVTDTGGRVLLNVKEVKVSNAKRTVVSQGVAQVIEDPLLKDVNLTLTVPVTIVNDRVYMFDFLPLKVGSPLPVVTKNVNLTSTVTKITSIE